MSEDARLGLPYIVQGLLEEVPPLLQRLRIQLDPPVGLVIQEAGQGHPVVRHVAYHGKEPQDELPVRLLCAKFKKLIVFTYNHSVHDRRNFPQAWPC